MQSKRPFLRITIVAGALTLGLLACSDRRRAGADREMEGTADRMTSDDVRREDAQKSTGAATGAGPGERAGNITDDNTRPLRGGANRAENLTATDRQWVVKTAQAGFAEVELAKLAQDKATGEVTQFAARLVNDHTRANDRLHQIASNKGVALAHAHDMDAGHQQLKARLEKLSGDQFNRTYVQEMIKEHKNDIQHFERGANRLNDPDLKAFAQNTLPTLKAHLKHAEELHGKMTR